MLYWTEHLHESGKDWLNIAFQKIIFQSIVTHRLNFSSHIVYILSATRRKNFIHTEKHILHRFICAFHFKFVLYLCGTHAFEFRILCSLT